MTVYIMQDGILDKNIKPTDLVLAKSNTKTTNVFVVLQNIPPNELRCLNRDNKIRILYMNKIRRL